MAKAKVGKKKVKAEAKESTVDEINGITALEWLVEKYELKLPFLNGFPVRIGGVVISRLTERVWNEYEWNPLQLEGVSPKPSWEEMKKACEGCMLCELREGCLKSLKSNADITLTDSVISIDGPATIEELGKSYIKHKSYIVAKYNELVKFVEKATLEELEEFNPKFHKLFQQGEE